MTTNDPERGTSVDGDGAAPSAEDLSRSCRVLAAAEKIAALGPITYEALRTELGISKTATWRLVATLKEAGWVRLKHGGRLIELDHRLDELFATAHFADPEFAGLADVMTCVAEERKMYLDLFVLSTKGELELYETTRRLTAAALPVDTLDESLMLAMWAAMTPQQLERHVLLVADTLEPEARRALRTLQNQIKMGSVPGYNWTGGGRFLDVSVRGSMGTPAVLRISARSGGACRDGLMCTLDLMRERVRPLVVAFAGQQGEA